MSGGSKSAVRTVAPRATRSATASGRRVIRTTSAGFVRSSSCSATRRPRLPAAPVRAMVMETPGVGEIVVSLTTINCSETGDDMEDWSHGETDEHPVRGGGARPHLPGGRRGGVAPGVSAASRARLCGGGAPRSWPGARTSIPCTSVGCSARYAMPGSRCHDRVRAVAGAWGDRPSRSPSAEVWDLVQGDERGARPARTQSGLPGRPLDPAVTDRSGRPRSAGRAEPSSIGSRWPTWRPGSGLTVHSDPGRVSGAGSGCTSARGCAGCWRISVSRRVSRSPRARDAAFAVE